MAVTFDAVGPSSSGQTATGTSTSWSHTVGAGNAVLLVGVAVGIGADGGITTTATYNGVSMTSLGKRHTNDQTAGYLEVFYLNAPASGTHSVVVTASTTVDLSCGSISFVGVDPTAPLGTPALTAGSTANPSATASAATGNYEVVFGACGAAFATPTQTSAWIANLNSSSGAGNGAAQYASGSGASKTYGWTIAADWWALLAVEVIAFTTGDTIAWTYGVRRG